MEGLGRIRCLVFLDREKSERDWWRLTFSVNRGPLYYLKEDKTTPMGDTR